MMLLLNLLLLASALISCSAPQGTEVGNGKQPTQNPQGTQPETTNNTDHPVPTFGEQDGDFTGIAERYHKALNVLFASCASPLAETLSGNFKVHIENGSDAPINLFTVASAGADILRVTLNNNKQRTVRRVSSSSYAISVMNAAGVAMNDAYTCQDNGNVTVGAELKRNFSITGPSLSATMEWQGSANLSGQIDVRTIRVTIGSETAIFEK